MSEGRKTIKKVKAGKIPHNFTEVDNIKFHSKMESKYYQYLMKLKNEKIITERGILVDIELQPEFLLQEKFIIINGRAVFASNPDFEKLKRKHNCKTIRAIKYKSDFKEIYDTGEVRLVDTKGASTTDFEIKRKMFMAKYPDLPLHVITESKGQWVDYYECDKQKKMKKKLKKENK